MTQQDADWVDRTFDGSNPNHGYMRTGAHEAIRYAREQTQAEIDRLRKELEREKKQHQADMEYWQSESMRNY